MRKFKFRGFNTITKTMLDLKACTPLAMSPSLKCDGVFLPFTDEIILMEHAGLKDLDWWEGDVFDHPRGRCVIVWRKGGLYMHGGDGYTPVWDAAVWATVPVKIGNRYDNPELLVGTRYEADKERK